MSRRNSPNCNDHNDQYRSQTSRPGRNQLRYGDDTSAYDDEFLSTRSAQAQSDRQRRVSARPLDEDRYYREQHRQHFSRPDRNQLGYGADNSAYDDDFFSPRSEESLNRQRRASTRSEQEDRNYRMDNRREYFEGRNISNDNRGYRYDWSEKDRQRRPRYVANSRRSGGAHPYDIDYVRYPDGGPGRGGESRRSRWFEDASFYEYRESLHDPNARRSAEYDMDHEDINYFDRERTLDRNTRRQGSRHNISDEDYYWQEQRNQDRRSHPDERWRDYNEPLRRQHDKRDRSRNRRW